MNIVIVTTPDGASRETGFSSPAVFSEIVHAVEKMGHRIETEMCACENDLHEVVKKKPNLVVLADRYLATGDEGGIWLAEYFDRHEINFTGTSRNAKHFDSDRLAARSHLKSKGVDCVGMVSVVAGQFGSACELPLNFPLMLISPGTTTATGVKPCKVVIDFAEYQNVLRSFGASHRSPVPVEEYPDGKAFRVMLIETRKGWQIVAVTQIKSPAAVNPPPQSNDVIRGKNIQRFHPVSDRMLAERIVKLALNAQRHLEARDFVNVDIRSNSRGECFFMATNQFPGMNSGADYFPGSCQAERALFYEKIVQLVIMNALLRASIRMTPARDYALEVLPKTSHFDLLLKRCSRAFSL